MVSYLSIILGYQGLAFPPQSGWPSPNLGPAVNDRLLGHPLPHSCLHLGSQLALLSVAVHPPSALPGQPPNGGDPKLCPLTQSLKGRGLPSDILWPSVHRSHHTVAVWPPPRTTQQMMMRCPRSQDRACSSVRQRVGSHHPRTHFLLFGGKASAARDHPYSRGAPYIALGRRVKTLLWKARWLDTFPICGPAGPNSKYFSLWQGRGRVGKGMKDKTESHWIVFLIFKTLKSFGAVQN